jgi:hypothetical protein
MTEASESLENSTIVVGDLPIWQSGVAEQCIIEQA